MPADPSSPSNKRQRLDSLHHDPSAVPSATSAEDAFITDQDAVESGGDDDDEEDKPKSDKKAGRRKIKIEFIQDKSRRHITFSKRKAGIMKKAYELSTLTGTQVLLLVVSETGLVYTFTTAKLQPLVTQPEGKNLIQACLNAPHGTLPSSMPVGQPIGRSAAMPMPSHVGAAPQGPANVPGGLSISGGKDEEDEQEAEEVNDRVSRKRRRASSSAGANQSSNSAANHANNANGPSSASGRANQSSPTLTNSSLQPPAPSPHLRPQPIPPNQASSTTSPPAPLTIPQSSSSSLDPHGHSHQSPRTAQSGSVATSPNYQHTPGYDAGGMYPQGAYGAPGAGAGGAGGAAPGGAGGYGGYGGEIHPAAAAAWGATQVQGGGYHRTR